MVCKKCNTANAEGTMFCTNCGALLNEESQYPTYDDGTTYSAEVPAKGLGIASMILGIVSLVGNLCCGSFFVPSIVGLVLAIIAKKKGNTSGPATTGFILSIIAIIVAVLWILGYIGYYVFFFLLLAAGSGY